MFKVLINVMDEAYAHQSLSRGYTKEFQTFTDVQKLIPSFRDYYDKYINMTKLSSITESDKQARFGFLIDSLRDVRSLLLETDESDVYFHFVGHGGHFPKYGVDEIQEIHYDVLFNSIHELFHDFHITVNLLGTCHSIYAQHYMGDGTLLCTARTDGTVDYLSPFQYTSLGFCETGDIEEFKRRCGNMGDYRKIELDPNN